MKSPIKFDVVYPASLSKPKLLLKTFLGLFYIVIPHGIVLFLYGMVACITCFLAWWVILITGRYPKGMFELLKNYYRYFLRVSVYLSFMTDDYPPFSGKE